MSNICPQALKKTTTKKQEKTTETIEVTKCVKPNNEIFKMTYQPKSNLWFVTFNCTYNTTPLDKITNESIPLQSLYYCDRETSEFVRKNKTPRQLLKNVRCSDSNNADKHSIMPTIRIFIGLFIVIVALGVIGFIKSYSKKSIKHVIEQRTGENVDGSESQNVSNSAVLHSNFEEQQFAPNFEKNETEPLLSRESSS